MSTGGQRAVAAGVVVFQPQADSLLGLIDTVAPEVGTVFVFLNGPIRSDLHHALAARRVVSVIEAGTNLGVGVALNMIMVAAARAHCEAVILFDQDSKPPAGMVSRLLALEERLRERGKRPAVVAPLLVSSDLHTSKPPTYRYRNAPKFDGEARPVDFAPTSGSLVQTDAWRAVGPFRSDYFIDGIDLEWNFRAWSRGYSCWIMPECRMIHSIGLGVISWPIFGFRMPAQQTFRMYCLVRNTCYGLRLRHIPLHWKLKQVAYLSAQIMFYWLHHHLSLTVLRILLSGATSGLQGRLGVPPGAPLASKEPVPNEC